MGGAAIRRCTKDETFVTETYRRDVVEPRLRACSRSIAVPKAFNHRKQGICESVHGLKRKRSSVQPKEAHMANAGYCDVVLQLFLYLFYFYRNVEGTLGTEVKTRIRSCA